MALTEDQEKQHAQEILDHLTLPPEIVKVEVRTGNDSSGDPAMWITLWIPKDLAYDEETFHLLYQAAEQVQTKLLASGFSRFPYTLLDQAA